MKQTENYQLNQWEKPDRIMMEDFNADNAKLDAVIKSETHRIEHMPHGEFVCGKIVDMDVSQVDLDVSGVDWNRYFLMLMAIELREAADVYIRTDQGKTSALRISTGSSAFLHDGMLANIGYSKGCFHVILPVFYDGSRPFNTLQFGLYGNFGYSSVPLEQINRFSLMGSKPEYFISTGSRFEIWGLR